MLILSVYYGRMLYVFVGHDVARAKAEARKLSKKSELVFFGEGGEPWEHVLSVIASQGLFSPTVSLILDRPFESSEGRDLFSEHAQELHKSALQIFVIAPTLNAAEKKFLPKEASFQTYDIPSTEEKAKPNIFAFSDLFLSGDRKRTWIGYRRLIASGISPEEIHGVLMWAVRSALLAGKTGNATQSGLKPFVFTKSKRVAERIGVAQIEDMSRRLVSLYHRARSGEGTLELGIEELLLEKT